MNYGLKVSKITLSVEKEVTEIDYRNTYTDVIVKLENGASFVATFFTYQYFLEQIQYHRQSGDFLSGKYFWTDLMILIEDCSAKNVEAVVEDMIDEGDFLLAFQRL